MAKKIEWLSDGRIQIEKPTKTKKVTGTRFATILGLNPWSTEFEMWCAITKTYEKPFEDTIYTIAGKTIEPKQADYMERLYGMNIVRPTDIYGEDYFKKTYGDFFKENAMFGGMWDYLSYDEENKKYDAILEMKTTKRIEDWQDDIPEYYALQAALYGWLKGINHIIMVASFLGQSDYENPDNFQPSIKNTIIREFDISKRYPNFPLMIQAVENWWNKYVVTGISPKFDEKKDAEILKALRTNTLNPNTNLDDVLKEAEQLKTELDEYTSKIKDKEKRLSTLTKIIKEKGMSEFRDGDKKVEIKGSTYCWTISKSVTTGVDKDALAADGILDKYKKTTESYKITVK